MSSWGHLLLTFIREAERELDQNFAQDESNTINKKHQQKNNCLMVTRETVGNYDWEMEF